jgi:voltage-gated potassium channel
MQRFVRILIILIGLVTTGALGFRLLEEGKPEATWLNCCYMAVTTLTTVGFGEVIPLSEGGRLFVMGYLFVGFSVFTYSAFTLGQLLLSNELQGLWEKRRMEQTIRSLEDHFLVCGLGRMGNTICKQLHQRKRPFVIVDRDESRLVALAKPFHWNYIVGDATDDEILKRAGIERAKSLAVTLPTDADNVYVVLSARLLRQDLQIIARASEEKAGAKLMQAGANRVVSPYSTAATKMARFMLNPNIEDFLEIADHSGHELELADIHIGPNSALIGKTLMETNLRELGVMVVGIRRADGERLMPPSGHNEIQARDCLFVFGSSEVVNKLIGDEMV